MEKQNIKDPLFIHEINSVLKVEKLDLPNDRDLTNRFWTEYISQNKHVIGRLVLIKKAFKGARITYAGSIIDRKIGEQEYFYHYCNDMLTKANSEIETKDP